MLNNEIENYTYPEDLSEAIISVLSPEPSHLICDGSSKQLGFLLAAKKYLETKYKSPVKLENFYGRGTNENASQVSLARAKELGFESSNFVNTDISQSGIQDVEKFDTIISVPPFGKMPAKQLGALGH